jgi:dipeptidase E
MELLLLSSSRTPAGYLVDYMAAIRAHAAGARRAVFVPFAAVSLPWDEYTARVSDALPGLPMVQARSADDLAGADLVIVGGGNTFQLLKECRTKGFLQAIKTRVLSGRTRYLGWSAGANLACPTIKTTNDMPIVDPGGLDALGLTNFQINPHYLNVALPGHHGETRDDRLAEFARANPQLPVIALPEGDWLYVSDSTLELHGAHPAVLFSGVRPPRPLVSGKLPPLFGDSA